MRKSIFGAIVYWWFLFNVFAVSGTLEAILYNLKDCTKPETTNYNPHYGRYRQNEDQSTECNGIDLSYITWILPPETYRLKAITCVHCKLDNSSTRLSRYTELRHLEIIDTVLFNITKEMFGNLDLMSLSIVGSDVSYVEDNSFASRYLEKLNLSFNSIEDISLFDRPITLTPLITLDLSSNLLQTVNLSRSLKTLYLRNNRLIITEYTFIGLKDLTFLDISNNSLSVLPDNVFNDLASLNNLNISHNNLMSLDYGSFSGLDKLADLDISYNYIITIPEYVYHDVHNLARLYINHNNLTDFHGRTLLANLPFLREVSISDNPWDCDTLSVSIRTLKSGKVHLLPGTCKTTPNIIKICCMKNENISTTSEDSQNTNNVLASLKNFYNRDFTNSKFYNFFIKDYKEQSFWKYFDGDYKKDSLFRFFDTGFLQSQFYRYFYRDYLNATFQNRIIDKIDHLSQNETNLNVTGLRDSLKSLFGDFFYNLNATNAMESFPRNEQLVQHSSPYNHVLIAVMTTIIVLLILYIISEKCKARAKNSILSKLKLYHMFRSNNTTVTEPEIEIL